MKRTLLLLFVLHRLCVAQTPEGQPVAGNNLAVSTGYPTCLVTNPFGAAGDRCAQWLTVFKNFLSEVGSGTTSYACVDARGEVSTASNSAIDCASDPFPVSTDYAGPNLPANISDVGGILYLPAGVMAVTSSLQVANNQTHVYGSGNGRLEGSSGFYGAPTSFTAASGFTPYYLGSTFCSSQPATCFSPAVVAFGAKAGDMATNSLGPYKQTVEGIDVEGATPGTSGVNAYIGFSMYSGQEGSSVKRLSVEDVLGTGIDWCGFYPHCGDGLLMDDFTVAHTFDSCVNPSTTVSFSGWTAPSALISGGSEVIIGTYTNTPSPAPQPGYYAKFSGLLCSGGSCPAGVDPNGTYRIAATWNGTTQLSADGRIAAFSLFTGISGNAIAWIIQGSTPVSTSPGSGGTGTLTTVEAALNGFSGREIKNATLDSGGHCTATPYAGMEVSGDGSTPVMQNIDNVHMEYSTYGAVIGEDGVTGGILGDDWNCSTAITTCVLLSSQFGGPTNSWLPPPISGVYRCWWN